MRSFPRRPISFGEFARFCCVGSACDAAGLVVALVAAGAAGLAFPMAVMIVFDVIVPQGQTGWMVQMGAGLLGMAVVRVLLEFFAGRAQLRWAVRSETLAGPAVWQRLFDLPVNVLRRDNSSEAGGRAQAACEVVREFSGTARVMMFPAVVVLVNLGFLLAMDVRFALIGSFMALGVALLAAGTFRYRVAAMKEDFQTRNALSGQVHEWLRGLSKIRLAGAEDAVLDVWRGGLHRLLIGTRRTAMGGLVSRAFLAGFLALGSAVLFASASTLELSVGKFLALFASYGSLMMGLLVLGESWPRISEITAQANQAAPVLAGTPETATDKVDPGVLTGDVEFTGIHFAYDPPAPGVLNNFSLHVQAGEFVALAGHSGSGKSTILRLLLGFERPAQGIVRLDGRDLRQLDIDRVRSQMGVVLQSPALFAGDLHQNIAGESDLSLPDAWQAAEMAGIAEEIRALPMQMHTVVTEGGLNFSFGQRQRIALARVFACRPGILLLDEATSALDARAQARVMKSLADLRCTRLMVTHCLSALARADRVLVLENGKIVESGPCSGLLAQRGAFFRLVERQMF